MFPSGTPVVTLTGTLPAAVAGDGYGGQVVLTPSALLTDTGRHAVYPGGGQVDIVDGTFTVQLIPNNAAGIEPDGWMWQVDVQPARGRRVVFWTDIHGTSGDTIHLDSLVPAQAPGGGNAGGSGADGADGKSAYELAVEQGFSGTISQWLASLVGPQGTAGATGAAGAAGATGAKGDKGDAGDPATNLVTSVAGKQGVVSLNATDVGADASGAATTAQAAAISTAAGYTDTQTATRVPTARQVTAGTGLTGGGTLAADRTLAVSFGTSGTTAAVGNDSRLSDARTPTAHKASHAVGGSDVLSPADIGAYTASNGTALEARTTTLEQVQSDLPSDQGLLAWTYDPNQAGHVTAQSNAGVAGRITLVRLILRKTITWSNVWIGLSGVDAAAVLANCYLGVYDSGGTLKGTTADISTSLMTGATAKPLALASSFTAAPGTYFIAMLLNGTWATNSLTFKASGAGVSVNAGLTAPSLRYSNLLSGQTSLPSSLTLSGQTTTIINTGWGSQWYGVS